MYSLVSPEWANRLLPALAEAAEAALAIFAFASSPVLRTLLLKARAEDEELAAEAANRREAADRAAISTEEGSSDVEICSREAPWVGNSGSKIESYARDGRPDLDLSAMNTPIAIWTTSKEPLQSALQACCRARE